MFPKNLVKTNEMKQFFKILFASTLGAVLGLILLFVILFFVVFGVVSSSSNEMVSYDEKNVIVLKNTISVGEITTPSMPTLFSSFEDDSKLGLFDILRVIDYAKNDSKIKGIVLDDLEIDAGYETVGEIAQALIDFKTSGKFVYGYFNTMSQKTYLLASVCDSLSMTAEGMAEFHGISSTSIHYKNLLEKVGLKPVVVRCGKYKSYVETYTNEKMSAENREQKQTYIDMVWGMYENMLARTRPIISSKLLNSIADSVLVCVPEEMLKYGFIDKIQYSDEFWNSVKTQIDIPLTEAVSTISLRSYVDDFQLRQLSAIDSKSKIALVIAQGSIDRGKSDEESIGSETYVKLFQKVRQDSSIKSVVFRINSGGGSALASELIWREVSLTAQEKPVIVSMGDMAASGGYYIATPATHIYASPMTLTGSIGVFGMSVNAENLMEKIGVTVDKVNTNQHSDFGNIMRDLDPIEIHAIQKSVDKTYATFKQRVSDGRKLDTAAVEEIAQGRVWSGTHASVNGLVDGVEFCSLKMSLSAAQHEANLQNGDFQIEVFPKPKTLYEELLDKIDTKTSVFENISKDFELLQIVKTAPKESGIYMQLPYSIDLR